MITIGARIAAGLTDSLVQVSDEFEHVGNWVVDLEQAIKAVVE
jgi:hypothetical protein